MTDQKILTVQKWLNQTYGNLPGFELVPESAQLDWPTVYGLRMGVQATLKQASLQQDFDATSQDALAKMIKSGALPPQLVQLIQGALWCQGRRENDFSGDFSPATQQAIQAFQKQVGVAATGKLSLALILALFNVNQYQLRDQGYATIRQIQQDLNHDYQAYIGIRPCDGCYQRDTNEALIYALQAAEGQSPKTASGHYDTRTAKQTPVLWPGANHPAIRVLKWALAAHGYSIDQDGSHYDEQTAAQVVAFRHFMALRPYEPLADLDVFAGLLTSQGNSQRAATVFDTPQILTDQKELDHLYDDLGYRIVGRYLTGTAGLNFRDKSLSITELQMLTEKGFAVFPIYSDCRYLDNYSNEFQGYSDAYTASNAARKLGFPIGTIIYFAIEPDLVNADFDYKLSAYLRAIQAVLAQTGYQMGIYGVRAVCQQAADLGIAYAFVADQFHDCPGNLGKAMPKNWTLDQFDHDRQHNLNRDGFSGRDTGLRQYQAPQLTAAKALRLFPEFGDLKLEQRKVLAANDWFILKVKASRLPANIGSIHVAKIKAGQIETKPLAQMLNALGCGQSNQLLDFILRKLNQISFKEKIQDGLLLMMKLDFLSENRVLVTMPYSIWVSDQGVLNENLTLTFTLTLDLPKFFQQLYDEVPNAAVKMLQLYQHDFALALAVMILATLFPKTEVPMTLAKSVHELKETTALMTKDQ